MFIGTPCILHQSFYIFPLFRLKRGKVDGVNSMNVNGLPEPFRTYHHPIDKPTYLHSDKPSYSDKPTYLHSDKPSYSDKPNYSEKTSYISTEKPPYALQEKSHQNPEKFRPQSVRSTESRNRLTFWSLKEWYFDAVLHRATVQIHSFITLLP